MIYYYPPVILSSDAVESLELLVVEAVPELQVGGASLIICAKIAALIILMSANGWIWSIIAATH